MKQTAIITGAGSGIGLGIAHALARRGVDLALVGRRAARLEIVARRLESLGVRAVALPADLANQVERRAVVDRARAALGPISMLVNNAAVMVGGDISTLSLEEIAVAVATNLLAPMELTRLALPDLHACGGSVVFVASSTSLVPLPSAAVYSATKAGVRALAESLRYELQPAGVHLLVAYPPATDTAMTRGMSEAAGMPAFLQAHPARVGERIAQAILTHKQEIYFGGPDRLLSAAYRLSPKLVRALLQTQHPRFAKMMSRNKR